MNWLRDKLKKWLGIKDLEFGLTSAQDTIIKLERLVNPEAIEHTVNRLAQLEYWLGQEGAVSEAAFDVHWHGGNTLLIVCSKLRGGMVKFIPLNMKRVDELIRICEMLYSEFGARQFYFDAPPGFNDAMQDQIRHLDKQSRKYK